jgi:hypothetical protein
MSEQVGLLESSVLVVAAAWVVVVGKMSSSDEQVLTSLFHVQPSVLRRNAPRAISLQIA